VRSEEDGNVMMTMTSRRTCKRRRAGVEKRRMTMMWKMMRNGKENVVEEGEGNDS
jgi:hypothetical protein